MDLVDLSIDAAEGTGLEELLLPLVSSASICAGEHAGSRDETLRVVELCQTFGVVYGAHPGYPDRENFGRRSMDDEEILDAKESLIFQTLWLKAIGARYVKPHGAFYNQSTKKGVAFDTLVSVLQESQLHLLGLPDSEHPLAAELAGVGFVPEGFIDRAYTDSGQLVPRENVGAVIDDPKVASIQAVRLVARVCSLCVHADSPSSELMLRAARVALEEAGYKIEAWA
ncbi:MAG: LamB/YcsF family protein [Fimbriimonadaceae bacterium]